MSDTSFDVKGLDELLKDVEIAGELFPKEMKKALREESKIAKKEFMQEYSKKIKGHGSKPGTLKKSFTVGRVIKKGNKFTTAVMSNAPHFHHVEDGHALYSHGKYAGKKVDGRHIVSDYMDNFEKNMDKVAKRVLDKVMEEAELK
jgi:hypothetical protein